MSLINKMFQKLFTNAFLSYQYCLDYDIEHHRHGIMDQFNDDFKYPGMLPGGALCMLHHAEREFRPNLGPYAFITPAGTYSRWHRDGGVSRGGVRLQSVLVWLVSTYIFIFVSTIKGYC